MGPVSEKSRGRRSSGAAQSPPPEDEEEMTAHVDAAVKRAPPKVPTASILRAPGRARSKAAPAASAAGSRRADQTSTRSPSQRLAGGPDACQSKAPGDGAAAGSKAQPLLYSEEDETAAQHEPHHDESQQLTGNGHMELAEIDEYEEGVSDEDSRSSPARSHAALALASMFRQKPATGAERGGGGGSAVGYAFPLDEDADADEDEGDLSRAQPKTTNGKRRGSGGKRGGGRAAPRRSSSEFLTTEATRPRKKDRKSAPFSSPCSHHLAAVWGTGNIMPDPFPSVPAVTGPHGLSGPASRGPALPMGPPMPVPKKEPQQSWDGRPRSAEMEEEYIRIAEQQAPLYGCMPYQTTTGSSSSAPPPRGGSSATGEPAAAYATYNRKEKSLGLLCENFIKRFGEQAPDRGIALHEAAKELGVERRRIYDIVNILESVCYVSRRCKNTYIWHGRMYLSSTLKQLQDEALELWPMDARRNGLAIPPNYAPRGEAGAKVGAQWPVKVPGLSEPGQATQDDRKEKSLGRLSQKFIQLFLVGYQVISLAGAAEKLLGPTMGTLTDKGMKTKVRRLYDIANVLTSLRLIDKVIVPESRKPSFRWVGVPAAVLLHQPPPMGGATADDQQQQQAQAQQGQPPPPRLMQQRPPVQHGSPGSAVTTTDSSPSIHTSPPSYAGAEHVSSARTSLAMAMHDNTGVGEMGPPPPAGGGGAPAPAGYYHPHLTSRMPTNPDEWQHWDGSSPEDDDDRGQAHHLMPTGRTQQQQRANHPPHLNSSRDRLAPWRPAAPDAGNYLRGLGMDVETAQQQQPPPHHMMGAAAAMEEQPEGPAGEPARGPRQKRPAPATTSKPMGHPTQTVQL